MLLTGDLVVGNFEGVLSDSGDVREMRAEVHQLLRICDADLAGRAAPARPGSPT